MRVPLPGPVDYRAPGIMSKEVMNSPDVNQLVKDFSGFLLSRM